MKLAGFLTLASTAIAAVAASHHTSYTIHRRLLDPSHASPFTPYGTVETDIDVASYALALRANTGAIVPPHGKFVPAENSGEAGHGQVDVSRAWVQVTVEVEGRDEDEWPRSAVKACHLLDATEETITLHLSTHAAPSLSGELESHPSLQPYAITYRLHSNSSRSDCLEESNRLRVPFNWNGEAKREVEVVLETKSVLPSPRILTSSTPNVQGSADPDKKPPVEQSFFQKYWIYIAGAGVAIALMGTQEPQGQQAASGK